MYSMGAQIISRSTGRSAVAAAAYRAGQKLRCAATGVLHDYTKKNDVIYSQILAPAHTPDFLLSRDNLWSEVERVEKRKDAQLARELRLSIPHQLSDAQAIELLNTWTEKVLVKRGMIADLAIHAPQVGLNLHAHVMLTTREIDRENQTFAKKNRDWNSRQLLLEIRESWAIACNEAAEKAGYAINWTHKSLHDQRQEAIASGDYVSLSAKSYTPTTHEGLAATAMRKKLTLEAQEKGVQLIDLLEEKAEESGAVGVLLENERAAAERAMAQRLADEMQQQQRELGRVIEAAHRFKPEQEPAPEQEPELEPAPEQEPEPAEAAPEQQGVVMSIQKLADEQQKISEQMRERDVLAQKMQKSASKQLEQLQRDQKQLEKEFQQAEKNAPLMHKFFNFLREKFGLEKVRTAQQERIMQRHERITKQAEKIESGLQYRLKKECCNDDLQRQHDEKYAEALKIGAVDAEYLHKLRASNVDFERECMINSSNLLFDEQRDFIGQQQQLGQLANDKKIVSLERFEQLVSDTQKLSDEAREVVREHQEQQRFEQLASAFVEHVGRERETNKYSPQNAQIAALQALRDVNNATDEEISEIVSLQQQFSEDEREIMIELSNLDRESLHQMLQADEQNSAQAQQQMQREQQQQQQKQQQHMSM